MAYGISQVKMAYPKWERYMFDLTCAFYCLLFNFSFVFLGAVSAFKATLFSVIFCMENSRATVG